MGVLCKRKREVFSGDTGIMGFVCELLFLLLKMILRWNSTKEEEKYFPSQVNWTTIFEFLTPTFSSLRFWSIVFLLIKKG